MKKIYLAPSCSMEIFESADIITSSTTQLVSDLDKYDNITSVNGNFWG